MPARPSTRPLASTPPPPERWAPPPNDGPVSVADAIRSGEAPRDLSGVRLIGEDLSGADLSGCDLTGADLSRANLSGAILVGADLSGATLHETVLEGAELAGARLVGASLEHARAARAGFGRADLSGARLFAADLQHASLVEAQLGDADLRSVTAHGARFGGAELRGADVGRADLKDVDLTDADVDGASFAAADMRGSRLRAVRGFERASFLRADLRDVDFSGAYMLRRHVLDENYLDELRSRSRMHAALYWAWWLSSDCGRSLSRWAGWTAVIAVAFALAYRAAGVDWGAHETWLSPLYYSVVTLTSLGYGDVLPTTVGAQALAMAEVSLGYLMLGGLISIFANKLARRGE